MLCQLVEHIFSQLTSRGTVGVLRPYLDDAVLFLVTQFRDPFSPVKVEALGIISMLALQPSLEQVRRSRVSPCAVILYLSLLWRTLRDSNVHHAKLAGNEVLRSRSGTRNTAASQT